MTRPMTGCNYLHAASVCANIETGLRAAVTRAQRAIEEAQAELQKMLDLVNEGRADRGLPPLDVQIKVPGERP